jgi:2-polyprenyl-6-methoxyphenol hydroxylase-like FAD-dependent oxidoreductase
VSYQLLERDLALDARGNGWGITLHWAKDALKKCVPKEIFDRLGTISVDYDMAKKDPGHYKFLNLETLERRYLSIADPTRSRVRREGLRQLLVPNLNILWGCKIGKIDLEHKDVTVTLADESIYRGKVVVGADGANSQTRKFLCPETGNNQLLPLRFIGVIITMSPETTSSIEKAIDPLMFQGCHPKSGVFMYYSILSTPESNGSISSSDPYFQAQVSVSWKPRNDEGEYPATSALKLQRMRELCSDMALPIKNMIYGIPDNSEAIEIKLQDWPCLDWSNHDGRITLAGDAAHAMTMCKLMIFSSCFSLIC